MFVQNMLFFILEHLLSVWDNCEHFLQMQMFEHSYKKKFKLNNIPKKTSYAGHIEIVLSLVLN